MKKNLREQQGVYAVHVIGDNEVNYTYIGSGFLGDRISGNPSKLRRNKHTNKQLQEAYNKFSNVKVEILEICDNAQDAIDLENDYIEYFKRLDGIVVCNVYRAYVPGKQYKRKLNVDDVINIRELIEEGVKNKELAEKYDVDPSTISRIKNNAMWQSVVS